MMEDHPAEDHLVEGHQENLLETPQKETNQGETTLGMMTSLMMRIRTTIQRMMRTEVIPLHQGEVQPHPLRLQLGPAQFHRVEG